LQRSATEETFSDGTLGNSDRNSDQKITLPRALRLEIDRGEDSNQTQKQRRLIAPSFSFDSFFKFPDQI
jgi:hypothetical protein